MAENDSFIKYSDFIVPDDSVEKLISLLDEVYAHMTKVSNSVPASAAKMAEAFKKVTGATIEGQNALDEMTDFVEKLRSAYHDLAYAQSDFGKALTIVKEQTREANREAVSQYRDSKMLKDSIDKLNASLEKQSALYKTLGEADRMGGLGKSLVTEIRSLTQQLGQMQKDLKASTGAVNDYIRAQVNLAKQQDSLAANTAKLNDMNARYRKGRKQAAVIANTEATSIEGLKARLDVLITRYRGLSEAQRGSTWGEEMRTNIMKLTEQYETLNAAMNGSSLSSAAMANASRKLALSQSEEAKAIAEKNIQARTNQFMTEASLKLDADLVMAEEKLKLAQSDRSVALEEVNQKINEQNRLNQTRAALLKYNIPIDTEARKQVDLARISYDGLTAMYEANAMELRQLSLADKEQRDSLVATQKQIAAVKATMEAGIQSGAGGLARLGRNFDGLSYSISQLLREAPAVAVSMNTFFLAISNNIPAVVDNIRKVIVANKAAKAAGLETVSVIKRIGKALVSFNAIMMLVVTLLTLFGEDILKWVTGLIKGNNVIISHTKALKKLKKQIKETSEAYGDGLSALMRMQLEWKNLTSDTERTKWIKNNQSEFTKLGVAVNSVADAENVLVKNTEAVINAMRLRAIAAAGEELAAEEYKKAMQEGASVAALELEYQEHAKNVRAEVESTFRSAVHGVPTDESEAAIVEAANKETERLLLTDEKRLKLNEKIAKAKEKEQGYIQNGLQYTKIALDYEQDALDALRAAGINPEDLRGGSGTGGREGAGRSIDEYIRNMSTTLIKKANDAAANAIEDGFAKRRAQIEAEAANELAELQKIYDKNDDILNRRGTYAKAKVSPEQERVLIAANERIGKVITDIQIATNRKLEKLELEHNLQMQKLLQERYKIELELGTSTAEEKLTIQKKLLDAQKQAEIDSYLKRSQDDRIFNERGQDIGLALIAQQYNKAEADLETQHEIDLNKIKLEGINTRLEAVKTGSDEELQLLLQKLEIEKQIALAENRLKPASERQSESAILAGFDTKSARTTGSFALTRLEEQQELERAQFEYENLTRPKTSVQLQRFELKQEKELWEKKIILAEAGMLEWSDIQLETAKQTVENLKAELKKLPLGLNEIIATIGEYGPGGSLLHVLGFDNDQIDQMKSATETIIGFVNDILDAQVEAAEKEIELYQDRIDAAKEWLDAEIEARNSGYANKVALAQRELYLQKQQQQKAILEKQKAQRAQASIDTITQVSSLVTASANLWSSLSSVPIVGSALALAAIAAMWGSFSMAKIKAAQVASSQQYGEGGLEFLEGGSHASGNDIDLGIDNSRHRRMRAEGGEALAIISKKRTRQYRDILPGIINSLNRGTFESTYMRSLDTPIGLQLAGVSQATDISRLESDVTKIKEELGYKRYTEDNHTIIKKGNLVQTVLR